MIRFCVLVAYLCLAYSCKTTQEEVSQTDSAIFAGAFIVNTLYEQPIEGTDLNLKIDDRGSNISG